MSKFLARHVLTTAVALALCSVLYGQEAKEAEKKPAPPSLGELRAFVEKARVGAAVSQTVKDAIAQAEAKLKAKKPHVAIQVMVQLERSVKLNVAEVDAVLDMYARIDKALGVQRGEVEKRVEEQLKQMAAKEEEVSVFLSKVQKDILVEKALRKIEAKELAEEASILLRLENKAKEAQELALRAVHLDSENKDAQDILDEAGMALGDPTAKRRWESKRLAALSNVRMQTALQELENTMAKASRLYARGQYGNSAKEWRKAETFVNALAPYRDMQKQSEIVLKNLLTAEAAAKEARAKAQEDRTEKERTEAEALFKKRVEESIRQRMEQDADLVDKVMRLIREKRFDEAERIIKDMEYRHPDDLMTTILRERIATEGHVHRLRRETRRHKEEAAALIERSYERIVPYEGYITFPDVREWKEEISPREAVAYPSATIAEDVPEEEKRVYAALKKEVEFVFEGSTIADVVNFLENVTDANFVLHPEAAAKEDTITLHIKTTVEEALDSVCWQTNLAWKVKGPKVQIGPPETIEEYARRVYDIRDLLVNIQDRAARRVGDDDDEFGDDDDDWGGGTTDWGDDDEGDDGRRGTEDLMDRADSLRLLIQFTIAPGTWTGGGRIGGVRAEEDDDDDEDWGGRGGVDRGVDVWGEAPGAGLEEGEGVGAVPERGPVIFFRGGNPGDLVIIHTREVHDQIEDLLRQLRRAQYIQVNVEARFLNVSNDFVKEVGFNWGSFSTDEEVFTGHGLSQRHRLAIFSPNFATAVPTLTADGRLVMTGATGLAGVPFIGTGLPVNEPSAGLNLNFSIFDEFSLAGFFRAMQKHNEGEVLSSPNITLMNAQRGYLSFNTAFNYVESFEIQDGIPVPQPLEIESTVTLEVRPIVGTDRRFVFLELRPYVSEVLEFQRFDFQTAVVAAGGDGAAGAAVTINNFIQLPVQTRQRLESTVMVPDRGVLLIGGLARISRSESETGVPVLSKIPFIKRLFVSDAKSHTRGTLLILVKPRIIILGEEEAKAY